ncbi:MAG TPA: alpha/beta hydrolase-fold protein [Candidatus Binatia bacterium]|nr:alpha/beta hydrolase-fold protein [Candidatus Binatia bacterium]
MCSLQSAARTTRLAIPTVIFLLLSFSLAACSDVPLPATPTLARLAFVEATASRVPTRAPAAPASADASVAHTASPSPGATPAPTGTSLPTPTATPRPTPCATPGQVEEGAFNSTTAGGDHRFSIYLPPCYAGDGYGYPVLYLLAGNIHDEHKWDELGIDEAANAAIDEGLAPPLLIVMPDGGWVANNTSGGPGSYESLMLSELIPYVETNYCASARPADRAIGGLSRGGYWALEIAFRFPQQFASVGGHSAALLDSFAGPTINPQYTGLNNDLDDLRIYLDIGAEDYVRANTIKLHEDMEKAGVTHEWHLNEGQHTDEYWTAHAANYLAWYVAPWSHDRSHYLPCSTSP